MLSYPLLWKNFVPQAKRHLPVAWQLMSVWNKLEMPTRATPLSIDMLLGFAGQLFRWEQRRVALMIVVAFCLFLRTGEMFLIRRRDVQLAPLPSGHRVVFLRDTKSVHRNVTQLEKLLPKDPVAAECLAALCFGQRTYRNL